MLFLDDTHDPTLRSWVESANDPVSDFPIQNLPLGIITRDDLPDGDARIGVAIGESVLDVPQALEEGVLQLPEEFAWTLLMSALNDFMAAGRESWSIFRRAVSELLRAENPALRDNLKARERALLPMNRVRMELPCVIGDYTDFYASLHHATNVGSMFRPDNPLMPNWKHLPVGYHGRASSIVVSGEPVRRPMGQTKADDAELPMFGPCKLLDYEFEMGFFVGPGNALGTRISMAEAAQCIFGMVIVNDWSARDVQKWEYQPLGPFNAKNFATTISPWVVTLEALAPYRLPGPPRGNDDPPTLEYLQPGDDESRRMAIDITCEVRLSSQTMREKGMSPVRISRGSFADMYWTIAQMLVHHASTGCNLQPGDLLASGTISGPTEDSRGCLLERTWRGRDPIDLPDGTQRRFLQDGDEVIMRAFCELSQTGAVRIGFGECRSVVRPAASP
jgi:fumarylacetoacetase